MIPGFIIAWLTFPGVIVHELGHQLMCRLFGVAVFQVKYFQFGTPSGYVLHETPKNVWAQIAIGLGPLLSNSIIGPIVAFPAAVNVMELGSGDPLDFFLMWLGISIAMHAFPSTGDAKSLWDSIKQPSVPLLPRALGTVVVGFIYVGALGSMMWLDLIYGLGLTMGMVQVAAAMSA